ncbi:MAG: hypothetical protein HXX14_01125 [Bacteroidetes bacterium]|nr:hypothetical protein [Bacteroidota bacterium]
MAQLKGPLLFTGSIGNIRSYYDRRLKRYVVSTKGGASKELINNNPTFARTRENMNEFKACGKWASQVRKSLLAIEHLHQGTYFAQIVAMGKRIQKYDEVNAKGFRSLESSKIPVLLTLLNFNKIHPFDRVLSSRYEIGLSDDKKTVTLRLPEFKSYSRLNWPKRFDYYRISLVIAQLPDFVWNEKDQNYQPTINNAERLSVSAFSDWHANNAEPEEICLTASFAEPALQQPGTTVIVALGIEVSAYPTGPNGNNFPGIGTMKIVQCFV